MAAIRTNPVIRESMVPTATTALERTSDVSTSVGLEPGSFEPELLWLRVLVVGTIRRHAGWPDGVTIGWGRVAGSPLRL